MDSECIFDLWIAYPHGCRVRAHVHSRQETDPKTLELAAVYLMENEVIPRLQTSLLGPAGESIILVADMSHFRHSNLDVEAAKQVAMTLQHFYPEYQPGLCWSQSKESHPHWNVSHFVGLCTSLC